jgi:flagellar M-ring protein FliF
MPTADRLFSNPALARLSALFARLARALSSVHPAIRWGSLVVGLAALLSLGYWAASALSTGGVRYLASGRRFSSEDLIKICRALDEHRITDYRLDDRRVAVSAEDFDDASTLLGKLDVGKHSIEEIRTQSSAMSLFWETTEDRLQREQLKDERILEAMIVKLPGVVWSLVSVHKPRGSMGMRNPPKPSAFVYLETEGDRQLPFGTVQAIANILRGYVRDLPVDSIRAMDRRGHKYLDPSDPALGDISRNRAREEELGEKILEKLDWIKGVRILVQVTTPHHDPSTTSGSGNTSTSTSGVSTSPRSADHGAASEKPAMDTMPDNPGTSVEIFVNRPAGPDLKPAPPLARAPAPAVAQVPGKTGAATSTAGDSTVEPARESGHVLVNVPRSFYYNALVNKTNHLDPSAEELRFMADRTELNVKNTLKVVLPEQGSWKVDVDTIPDELPLLRPAVFSYPVESRRKALDWGIVGAVGAAISIMAAVGSWVRVARRPARVAEPEPRTSRYRADLASEPGPSERVRELVRRNPEAAASVLQRWTVAGGADS